MPSLASLASTTDAAALVVVVNPEGTKSDDIEVLEPCSWLSVEEFISEAFGSQ